MIKIGDILGIRFENSSIILSGETANKFIEDALLLNKKAIKEDEISRDKNDNIHIVKIDNKGIIAEVDGFDDLIKELLSLRSYLFKE